VPHGPPPLLNCIGGLFRVLRRQRLVIESAALHNVREGRWMNKEKQRQRVYMCV